MDAESKTDDVHARGGSHRAFLLKRFIAFDNAMECTRDVTGYIGPACFLGTTVNAAFSSIGEKVLQPSSVGA
jgi:hypothetical protein